MASEYLLKKYKDVKPDEPKELTKKEKRANWWHYHRLTLLIIALAAALVISFIWAIVREIAGYQPPAPAGPDSGNAEEEGGEA